MTQYQNLIDKKNRWLLSHISVKYPTAESVAGSQLYLAREKEIEYQECTPHSLDTNGLSCPDEIYRADFHRITVMFAQQQSGRWNDAEEAALVLEFLAQITLDEEHEIYIGFENGEPVCSAIVTIGDGTVLISDFYTGSTKANICERFLHRLIDSDEKFSSSDTIIIGIDQRR